MKKVRKQIIFRLSEEKATKFSELLEEKRLSTQDVLEMLVDEFMGGQNEMLERILELESKISAIKNLLK